MNVMYVTIFGALKFSGYVDMIICFCSFQSGNLQMVLLDTNVL